MKRERQIIFYGKYFLDFYLKHNSKVQKKIEYVFTVIKTVNKVPKKFLKLIEGEKGLYEIRVEFESNIYRIFCCFDRDNLIVLFNAFQKKTQKTPKQEIEFAKKLMVEYFNSKAKTK